MLRALRSGGFVQILMVGVVFAIIAVFVLEFRAAGGEQSGSLRRECVIRLDGHCVSVKDYMASYGLIVPRGLPGKAIKQLSLRRHIFDGLVERELLVAEADKLGVSVTDQSIDDELARGHAHVSLPAEQLVQLGYQLDLTRGDSEGLARELVRELPVLNSKTRQFDYDVYKRAVRNTTRRSEKEFKNLQRREIIAARMRDLVRSRVRISEEEAFETYERERSRAVIRFVKIDREWFARHAVDTSDAAADAFAKKNKAAVDEAWKTQADSYEKDCLLGRELFVAVPPNATDDDKVLLREKIGQAKQRLEQGDAFTAVAKELSDGPTAAVGGRLGCVAKQGPTEPLAAVLETLEPGQVSDVVETERGFHLLHFDGRLEGDPKDHGRREVARQLAVDQGKAALAQDFAKALIERATVQTRLEDAVAELVAEFEQPRQGAKGKGKRENSDEDETPSESDPLRPKVEISAPFTVNQSPVPGALPMLPLAQMAFDLAEVDAVLPEPVPTVSGLAVVQLKEKTPATREEFDKDKGLIVRQIRVAKEIDALERYVDRLRDSYKDKLESNPQLVSDSEAEDDA